MKVLLYVKQVGRYMYIGTYFSSYKIKVAFNGIVIGRYYSHILGRVLSTLLCVNTAVTPVRMDLFN